jgi:hypothetical protein
MISLVAFLKHSCLRVGALREASRVAMNSRGAGKLGSQFKLTGCILNYDSDINNNPAKDIKNMIPCAKYCRTHRRCSDSVASSVE